MAGNKSVTIIIAGEDKSSGVLDAVEKHLEEVRRHAQDADSAMAKFGATAGRALERLGIAFGVREVLRGMEELVKHSVDLGVELGHLSKQTGISSENLSVLKYAADQTGVSFETFTKGFKKLSETLYEYEHGSKQATQAFSEIGVSQKELKATGGDLYAVMELVADQMAKMPDGFQKNAAATKLFGRAGQDLIPVLDQGGAGIEKFRAEAEDLGLVLDSSTIDKMEELHRSIVSMEGAFSGLALEITSQLAPALKEMAHDATEVVKAFHASPADGLKMMLSNALSNISAEGSRARALSDRLRQEALGDEAARNQASAAAHAADSKATSSGASGINVNDEEAAAKMLAAIEHYQAAKRQLLEGYAKLDLERQKSTSEVMMAELDSAHEQHLVSDGIYYAKKRQLEDQAFAAERNALSNQEAAIEKQMDEVRKRKPKDAATGKKNAADMLELEQKLLEVRGQSVELEGKYLSTQSQIAAKAAEAAEKTKEQSAALATELEKLQGSGTSKQTAESQVKYQDKRQTTANQYGANSPEVRELDAIQKLEEAKLRLTALDQNISSIENQEKMQELQLEEQLLSRRISEVNYARQLQVLRLQEAAQLKNLQGEYNQVANAAGQAGEEAKVKLEESITGIEQSVQKLKSSMLQDLLPVLEQLEMHPKKWQDAFKKAADAIQGDILKIANARLMDALGVGDNSVGKGGAPAGRRGVSGLGGLGSIFGKLLGGGGAGKASNGGLATGAGTIPDAVTSSLQQGRGGTGGAGVIVNLITQGTPQQSTSSSSSGDGKFEQQIISIVLKDAETLGPMTKGLGGAISMLGSGGS